MREPSQTADLERPQHEENALQRGKTRARDMRDRDRRQKDRGDCKVTKI